MSAKKKAKPIELKVSFKMVDIQIIKFSINQPLEIETSLTNFNFKITPDVRIADQLHHIAAIMNIEVETMDMLHQFANMSIGYVFEIENFDEVIPLDANGLYNVPDPLVVTLLSVATSTTRGILFTYLKGTFLHNAILPIIDPSTLLAPRADAKP